MSLTDPEQKFSHRESAVALLQGIMEDRTAFVFALCDADPRAMLGRMEPIAKCTYYADNNTGIVMSVSGPGGARMLSYLYGLNPEQGMGIVAVVPKTVPAASLAAILQIEIPQDGSRDVILLLQNGEHPIAWPRIMIDALDSVYPDFTKAVRDAEVKK